MFLEDIVSKMEVVKSNISNNIEFENAFLDSRIVTKNSLFFAVKGENTDGNIYAKTALDNGAACVIMDDEKQYDLIDGNKILVKNTIDFIKEFGKYRFDNYSGRKIAVTGSFGKTGMKESLKSIFGEVETVYGTYGNKNNLLGVSLTGCGINDKASTIIIELGSNNVGEISELSKLIKPNIALVTNVGHAHIGRFKSLERIIFEKLSISDGLNKDGILVAPQFLKPFVPKGDYNFYSFGEAKSASIYMTEYSHKGEYILFKTSIDNTEYRFNNPYLHVASNLLGAIIVASLCGISSEKIANAISKVQIPEGHGNVIKINNMLIINDTYNAGFESIINSAESLDLIDADYKYAIYGEMGEIEGYERELYNEITQLAYTYKDINFYLVGESYLDASSLTNRKIYKEKNECALEIVNHLKEISKDKKIAIVIKASRAKKFEEILEVLKQEIK